MSDDPKTHTPAPPTLDSALTEAARILRYTETVTDDRDHAHLVDLADRWITIASLRRDFGD